MKIKMAIIVTDKKLFAIILYSAFVNHGFLISGRDIWKDLWVTEIAGESAITLVGLFVPVILSAIIFALGFGPEGVAAGSFGSWFMSLYGGVIPRGSLVSVLQSIGAAGLGPLGKALVGALKILIGAVGN